MIVYIAIDTSSSNTRILILFNEKKKISFFFPLFEFTKKKKKKKKNQTPSQGHSPAISNAKTVERKLLTKAGIGAYAPNLKTPE